MIFCRFLQKSGLRFDQIVHQSFHLQGSCGFSAAAGNILYLAALGNQLGQVFLQLGKRAGDHLVVFQPFFFGVFDSLGQSFGYNVGKRFVGHQFHGTVKIKVGNFAARGCRCRTNVLQFADDFGIGLSQTAGQNSGKIVTVDNAAFAAGHLRLVFGQSLLQDIAAFLVRVMSDGFQPLAFLFQIFHIFLQRSSARKTLEDGFNFRRQFQQHFVEGLAPFFAENMQLAEDI